MGEEIARSFDRRTLVGAVADDLVAWLRQGRVAVGDQLPTMPVLMEEFGVGRSTIREAVKSLAYAGILDVTAGRGTYLVAHPDDIESLPNYLRRAESAQLDDLRRTLEGQIARLAAERRSADEFDAIERIALECEQAGRNSDASSLADADFRFHMAICAAARHDVYAYLYKNLRTIVRDDVSSRSQTELTGVVHGMHTNHSRLVEALRAQDSDAAYDVWAIADDCFATSPRRGENTSVRP